MKKTQDMVKAGKTMNGNPTILIVDSDTDGRKRLSAIFKKGGFEVLAVGTANEAIAGARERSFSVVLLDIELPDTPGTELIAPLRKLQPDAAILMVAAEPTLDSAVRSINEGAHGYLTKPLNMDEVLAKAADVLEKQRLVTENRMLHEEVRHSEEHYRTITENMTDTVWVMDLDFKATYISPSVTKYRGYTLKELNALPLDKHLTPQSLEILKSIIAEEMTADRLADKDVTISRSMELEFYRKDGTTLWGELSVTLVRDADGKPREIIGVGRDVTERKKSEAALLRAAQEWRTTFDSITDMISIQDADYRILRVSRSFADFVKMSPKDLIGRLCYEVIHGTKEPPPFCPHKKVFETKQSVEEEIFEPRLGIYMQLVDSPIFDADGNVAGSVHVIKDITDRKRAEEALIESEGRYRNLFEGATVGIFHSLPEGRYLRVNTALARMVGFDSPEEMVSSIKDIASELYVDPGQGTALHDEAVKKGGWATTEGQFKRRDGSIRWGRQWVHPVNNPDGTVKYLEGFVEDITDRKIAEEKIRESERTLSMAQRIASVGSWDWNLVTDRLAWSEETFRIFERDPATYVPVASDTLASVHPDDREQAERAVVQAVKNGETYELEYRIITPAGEEKWIYALGEIVRDAKGSPIRLRGAVQDITERKRAEDTLRESEERFKQVTESAEEWIWEVDTTGLYIYTSPVVEKILGYKPEEIVAKKHYYDFFHPEDKESLKAAALAAFASGKPFQEFINRNVHKNGQTVWLATSGSPLFDDKGSLRGYRGADTDITERKRAEEALRESEEKHRTILHTMEDGYFEVDLKGSFTAFNESMRRMLGYEQDDMVGLNYHTYMSTEDAGKVFTVFNEVFRTGVPAKTSDWRLIRKDNTTIDIETSISLKRDGSGAPIGFFGISRDVTERKRVEEALRKEQRDSLLILDSSPVIIFYKDKEGKFIRVNRTFAGVLGMLEKDMVGKTVFDLYPLEIAQGMADDDQEVIESGRAKLAIIEQHKSADGLRWVQTDKIPIYDENNTVIGLAGFAQDINERKEAENALRESERELKYSQQIAHLGSWRLDINTNQVMWTEELYKMYGFDPTLPPPPYTEHKKLFTPVSWERMSASLANTKETGVPYELELETVRKDGSNGWMWVRGEAIKDSKGNITGLWGAAQDISERKQAEEVLRQSEERYRLLLGNISDVVFNIDAAGTITYMSPVVEEISGYMPDEYLQRNFAEFIHPDDLPHLTANFGRSLQGIKEDAEFRVVTKDGSYRYVRSSSNPVMYGGSVVGLTGLITDITERKQAEDELRKSEERFRLGSTSASDLIWDWDIKQGSLNWYGNIDEMLGYNLGEFPRTIEAWQEVIHPEDRDRVLAALEQHVKKKAPYNEEYRVIQKDGTIRYWTDRGSAMFDETGNAYGMIGACSDITERRQAEENIQEINRLLFDRTLELRESEEKFRSLFETSRDFMCITDLEGRFIDTNDAGREFFGYSPEDFSEITMLDLYPDPEDRQGIINGIIEKGYITNLETKLKKKSGEIVDVLVSVNLKKDDNGKPVHFFASARDMTEKKRMEMQLLQSEKLSAVGTMISGVAHELNNPLTSIIGNAQLLSRRDVPDDVRAKLEVILKESRRSAKIVGGLLAFAREHRPERIMTDINEILTESLKLREYDLRVSNIDVRTSLADDLPETFVDPYQLQQVFINLINNSRDALAGQEQAALLIRSYRKDGLLLVEFEDNGPGIPDDLINRIFDPFFTTKDVGKGTGLGLSMAYGIIHEHNGTIEVRSKPGKGSKFTITLPLIEGGKTVQEESRAHIQAPPGAKGVLVVEDETSLRDLLSDALTEAGFLIETASTGEEAVSLLEIRHFDAVVSDIKMPGIGGRELYLYIQKHHPEIAEKVIFMTGDVLSKDTQSFLQITNSRFIEKPFDVDALVAMLNDLVST